MKFCKDCKHYQAMRDGLLGDRIRVDWCTKNLTYDLVSGQPVFRFANVERVIVNEPDHCCKDAKWFEDKEEADLDDLSKIPFGKQPS